jgi:arylsulfatase A-like enzyme
MDKKPNIVMIINDHQAYYRHGWDGGVKPKRPNFERLASEGIEFNRAYAVAPLCVPIRTTLLTGLYPHNHKNTQNNTHAPFSHELIFETLERNGYSNYYFGKWHAGPGKATDFGPAGFSREDYGNPYISREYKEYLKENNLEMPKRKIEKVFGSSNFGTQHPDLVEGSSSYESDKYFSGENAVGISLAPKETHESFFLADIACKQLKKHAEESNEKENPFFMRIDFWGPHHPHFPSAEFADMYNPEDIQEYGSFSDSLQGKPDIYRESYDPLLDENGKLISPNPLTKETWQLICARAFAHISQVDAAGGKVLDYLDELGLKEDTVVIWTTDHGDAMASHGGQWDKGSYMTEEVMRVPLTIRYPGEIEPGIKSDALMNTVDLPKTILDFAGTEFKGSDDGESLVPVCKDPGFILREDILCETYGIGFGKFHNGKALITDRYKYIWNEGDYDELYDLEEDPYETENLLFHKDSSDLQDQLRNRLFDWLERTGGETDMVLNDLNSKQKMFKK